jgi:methionyl-tRNA formyltransferase
METKLRAIILTHGGAEAVLERLLSVECIEVAGIFMEAVKPRRRSFREKLKRAIRYHGYFGVAKKFGVSLVRTFSGSNGHGDGLDQSRRRLAEVAETAGIPVHFVDDYHSQESISLMRAANPGLGVVFGANILKESVFKIPRLGSINLHQGLAPYYRGGPPVFWELFNGERELGLTVHFVEAKVDSGDIVMRTTVPLDYDYAYGLNFDAFISDFRRGLRDRCAQLVANAARAIAEGRANPVPQDITLGHRYRLPTIKEKKELRRLLRQRLRQGLVVAERTEAQC